MKYKTYIIRDLLLTDNLFIFITVGKNVHCLDIVFKKTGSSGTIIHHPDPEMSTGFERFSSEKDSPGERFQQCRTTVSITRFL